MADIPAAVHVITRDDIRRVVVAGDQLDTPEHRVAHHDAQHPLLLGEADGRRWRLGARRPTTG